MAVTPGGVIGSAPVGFQPIGASTPTLAVAAAVATSASDGVGASLFPAIAVAEGSVTSGVIGASLFAASATSAGQTTAQVATAAIKDAAGSSIGVTITTGVAATLADAGAMSSASTNIAAATGASLAAAIATSQLPGELAGGLGGSIANNPIASLPIGAQTQRGSISIAVSNAFKASLASAAGYATVTPVLWGRVVTQFNVAGLTTTYGVGSRGYIWDFDSTDPETIYVIAEPRSMYADNEYRNMNVTFEKRSLLTSIPVKLQQNPRYRRVA